MDHRAGEKGEEVTERRLEGAKEMGRQGCTQDSRLLLLPKEGLRKTRVSCLPYLRDKGLDFLACALWTGSTAQGQVTGSQPKAQRTERKE